MPYVILIRKTGDQALAEKQTKIIRAVCTGIDKLRQDLYVIDVVEAKRIADFLNWLPQNRYKFDIPEISKALREAKYTYKMPSFEGDIDFDTEGNLIRFMRKEFRLDLPSHFEHLTDLDNPKKRPVWWRLKEPPDVPEIGPGIPKGSNEYEYLAPLVVIWAPNKPGKLRTVLSAIREFDLLFVETANVGEHGLIYLFPKDCLHTDQLTRLGAYAYEILKVKDLPDDLCKRIQERLLPENCVVREVEGLLLKVKDTPEGLLTALQDLHDDIRQIINRNEVNIEGVHAFSYRDIGLCFILMREQDLHRAIMAFRQRRGR